MPSYHIEDSGNARFFDSSENVISGVGENTNITDVQLTDLLVFVIQLGRYASGACNKTTDSEAVYLQFNKDGEGWVTVGAATEISYSTGTSLSDGSATPDRITAGTMTDGFAAACNNGWQAGEEDENNAVTMSVGANYYSDIAFGLDFSNATPGSTYTFRLVNGTNGDTALTQLTTLPSVTMYVLGDIDIGSGDTLYESVTVDDDTLDLALELVPNVYDEVNLDDDTLDLAFELVPNVFDSIDVDAELGVTVEVQDKAPFEIDVYDEISLEEYLDVIPDLAIDIYDEVTVDEWNDLAFEIVPNVFDSVTVDEWTDLAFELVPSVYDEVTVTEDKTVEVEEAVFEGLEIDVNDHLEVWSYLKLKRKKNIHYDKPAAGSGNGNRNTRTEIVPESLGFTPEYIRILMGADGTTCRYEEVTVALQDTDSTYDTGPPDTTTQVLFSGSRLCVVPGNDTLWSDEIPFPYEITSNILIHTYVGTIYHGAVYVVPGNNEWYHLSRYTSDADVADLTGLGYSAVSNTVYGVIAVEGLTESNDIFWSYVTLFIQQYQAHSDVSITEDVTVDVEPPTPTPNVYDGVTVEESVTAELFSENLFVNVYEAVTAEDKTPIYQQLYDTKVDVAIDVGVNVNDPVSVDEAVEVALQLKISVYDAVTVEEYEDLAFELVIDVYDSVSIDEYNPAQLEIEGEYNVSVYDEISVDESTTGDLYLFPSVYDSVTLEESIDLAFELVPSVYDSVTAEESVDLAQELVISVYDSITVDESVSYVFEFIFVSVYDSITIEESTDQYFEFLFVSVYDSITVDEYNPVIVEEEGVHTVVVHDTVTVDESVDLIPDLAVVVYSEVTVDESIETAQESYISVYDSVGTNESVEVAPELVVSIYDGVTVDEYCSVTTVLCVSVYDSVTTDESDTAFIWSDLDVSIYDSVTLAEDIEVAPEVVISVYDEITISEYVEGWLSDRRMNIYDSVTVEEYVNVGIFNVIPGNVAIIDDIVVITGDLSVEEALPGTDVVLITPTISVELL